MGSVVNDVVDIGGNIVDTVVDVAKDTVNVVEDVVTDISKEANRAYKDFEDSFNYIEWNVTGQKARDERSLKQMQDRLNELKYISEKQSDRLDNKKFLEWSFKTLDSKALESTVSQYKDLYDYYKIKADEYERDSSLGSSWGWDDTLTLGTITAGKFVISVLSFVAYNIKNYIDTGDESYIRQVGLLVLNIVAIVLIIKSGNWEYLPYVIANIIAIITLVLTIDSIANSSGLLQAVFSVIDQVVNDILNIDSVLHTQGFSSDSEYYKSMMNNTRMSFALASLVSNVYAWWTAPANAPVSAANASNASSNAAASTGSQVTSQPITSITQYPISAISKATGVSEGTLSSMYEAYAFATSINDVAEAIKLRNSIGKRLEEYQDQLNKQTSESISKKMEASYSDAEYIMNQTDLSYHSYVLAMSEGRLSDVYDPEGTVVMNTRYRPQPSYTFGFEDLFQYNSMAGGDTYIYKTLWGKT